MNSIDLAKMGLNNLFRRKARTFLTLLGVIIGTTAIVVMISLGIGMENAFTAQLAEAGSLTEISVYPSFGGGVTTNSSSSQNTVVLDEQTKKEFEAIPNVQYVLALKRFQAEVVSGRLKTWANITGIDFDDLPKLNLELESGELPSKLGKNEVLYGGAADEFYDPKSKNPWENTQTLDVYKERITIVPMVDTQGKRVQGLQVKVTGIIPEANWQYSQMVLVDIDQYEEFIKNFNRKYGIKEERQSTANRNKRTNKFDEMKVGVEGVENVQAVQETIKAAGFEAFSMNDYLQQMKAVTGMIQAVLGGIGGVAMLVAAIGITNTMVMSIYERTREIGVMKVIGAQLSDIKRLFLFEAAMIGIMGGIIGILLSYGLGSVINTIFASTVEGGGLPVQSAIPPWLVLLGIGFSGAVGLVAGYYPAVRATKLSALEAIRTE